MAKIIVKNKKAKFNYELLNKYIAGMVLTGSEVKSIRAGKVSLQNSFIIIKDNEMWIINMNISSYMQQKSDVLRTRKLLLNKSEITRIKHIIESKHLTIIPITLFFNTSGFIKLEFYLARGKKKANKKEDIKTKEVNRIIQSRLKNKLYN